MALSKITNLSITDDAVRTVGIKDDNVTTAKILDNNVTLAKLGDGTQGDILYYGASGAPARLGFGTSGDFLKTQGTGANPVWAPAGGDNTPYFAASIGSSYTLTHEVYHKMEYDTEIYDSDSAYDTTLFRFTVPAGEGGYYQFGYSNRCASGYPGTMGVYQTEIYKNGSSMDLGGSGTQGGFYWNAYSAQRSIMATNTFIVSLAAADYIELFSWQGSLDYGNEQVIGEWSYFWGMKLLT
jgi:hypothetical protein